MRTALAILASLSLYAAPKAQIFALAQSGSIVAAGGWKEVRLQDPTGKLIATLPGHIESVRALAFSKDGKRLAAAGGTPGKKGEVIVWNVDDKTPGAKFEGHYDAIFAVAFSPDGKNIATASYDKLIKIWDAETGKEIRTLKDHIDAIYALAYTPDGTKLLSGSADRSVKVWDPATGTRLYTLSEPTDGINTIAVDPTGKFVAAGGIDKTIRIWALEAKSGRLLNSQIAHEDAILKLAWSPDGANLVSSSADRSIKIFRASDLTELKQIAKQPDWVYGIEFTPDSKTFIAGRYDGSLTAYENRGN